MPNQPSDQQLVDRANHGDATAFEMLYDRHRDWVISLAFRLTEDRELALDVMQDTFTYWLAKFPGFELRSQVKTFLYPAVRHLAIVAGQRTRRERPVPHHETEAEPAPQGGPDSLESLASALDRLGSGQREVIILRFADELSLQDIAVALEIPLGTVKSRLHLALRTLRDQPELRDFFETR